jgi:hypothetical protein
MELKKEENITFPQFNERRRVNGFLRLLLVKKRGESDFFKYFRLSNVRVGD